MTTDVEKINARMMKRYRDGVSIELTAEGALLVTLNGEHYVNSDGAIGIALMKITTALADLSRAGELDQGDVNGE